MNNTPLIFVALDTQDLDQAKHWATEIGPITGALKLGMEFINTHGPQGIEAIQNTAPDAALFIDLKFHDIPNTVAKAVQTMCTRFKPAYINVHASGGTDMMIAARESCEGSSGSKTKLLAVTILTSLNQAAISAIGYSDTLENQVMRMAKAAQDANLDGIVCSPQEIELIRKSCNENFETMTPGIRPINSDKADQSRTMTPIEAIKAGATNLVIGRPITNAPDPVKAATDILKRI